MELVTLRDIAYRYVRDGILERRWQPGERLREDLIAEELGMSRTPVREAINRLAAQGLAINIRRKGIYVADWQVTDALELLDVREYLEYLAVERICARTGETDLGVLDASLAAFEAAVQQERWEAAMTCDREFHRAIITLAGNKHLLSIYSEATAQIELTQVLNCRSTAEFTQAGREHAAIVAALRAKDAAAARQAVGAHLSRVRQSLQRQVDTIASGAKGNVDAAAAKGA